jgi:exodeoxyribonuclease VII large subunit
LADRPYSVTEITRALKQTIDVEFPPLWVVGEMVSYTEHASGHRYFTLKDEQSQLRCVMWRSTQLRNFKPESGMEVVARGRLSVYERSGQYQLTVQKLMPAGVGAQQQALEALKRKLQKEGLFDEERKRPLPAFPTAVGVLTSASGAAFRDILNVLARRFAGLRVVLRPAVVQGDGAPSSISGGVADLNALGGLDVLIVGRGGGAAEDLAAFNTEVVVRAVAASEVPVISAVGHEIDFTLTDLVADVRAPTPSAAAELVVRDAADLRSRVRDLHRRVLDSMDRLIAENDELLEGYGERYGLRRVEDLIVQHVQTIDDLERSLRRGTAQAFERRYADYRRLTASLDSLSPLSVLSRGYSITQSEDGVPIRDAERLSKGDRVSIRLEKGQVQATVDAVEPEDEDGQFRLGI